MRRSALRAVAFIALGVLLAFSVDFISREVRTEESSLSTDQVVATATVTPEEVGAEDGQWLLGEDGSNSGFRLLLGFAAIAGAAVAGRLYSRRKAN